MNSLNVGDLSSSFQKQLQTARLKTDFNRLTTELSSGKVQDMREATRGNFTILASLEHQIGTLSAYDVAAKEASLFGTALQTALESVQSNVEAFAPELLSAADGASGAGIEAAASDARSRFSSVVSAFNTRAADRSLLGGIATGAPALADGETMLAELATLVAGETTAADVTAAVDAWFDTPAGGFETNGYLGSTTSLDPFRVGPDESVRMEFKASDQEVRDVLKGYALSALIDLGTLSASAEERVALTRTAGERLFNANTGLATFRGAIGSAEAAIDEAATRNASETSALEIARNEIIAADPYETAVDLEAVQLQLETLFALTARAQRLSLTEYL